MNIRTDLDNLGLLAGTMGAAAKIYHVGFVVPDLEEAMSTLGQTLGVRFTEPMTLPYPTLHTPQGAQDVTLRFAYSALPAHIELISDAPGSLWDFNSDLRGHHIGVWTDDIKAEAERLEAAGMRKLWWATDEKGDLSGFSYHQTPYGFYIELVDAVAREFYPDWFRAAEPKLQG